MAEGDTILRLAWRFEAALVGETVTATAANPRTTYWCPRCQV